MRQEPVQEQALGRIAAQQHGIVTLEQAVRCGITPSGISRRVRAGRLHRIHRGVYAVGHRGLPWEGRWLAAVKACGEGAVLSHRSAGSLWQILAAAPRDRDVNRPIRSRVGRFLVDFLWRDHRLVVETDGYRFHRGRTAFEGDRQRDVQLQLLGYEVVRFTHRQVVEHGPQVARALRALLAQQRRLVILEPVPDQ
jgi:very-short-patch-repair endonuclease